MRADPVLRVAEDTVAVAATGATLLAAHSLLNWRLLRKTPAEPTEEEARPTVSVLIPARDEADRGRGLGGDPRADGVPQARIAAAGAVVARGEELPVVHLCEVLGVRAEPGGTGVRPVPAGGGPALNERFEPC